MATKGVEVVCGGCGTTAPSTQIKQQVMIPDGWIRVNVRRSSHDGGFSASYGQVNICQPACSNAALVDKFR